MGVVTGGGVARAARTLPAASGSPKKDGGLFTFCPGPANGRAPARPAARSAEAAPKMAAARAGAGGSGAALR